MHFKKFLLLTGFLLFFMGGSLSFANIYYLPHIHTGSDAWETYLIADSVLYGPAYYKLTLYDDNGDIVATQTGTIPVNQELRISLRELGGTSGIFETKSYPVRVRAGYIAKDSLGGGTAEFPLTTKLSRQAVMTLSNYYDQLNWSGFALYNGSDRDISVTATGYKDGATVFTKSFDMEAHTKVVDFFDSFFGLNSFEDIDTVIFSTDYPALTGIVISGKDNDKLLFSPSEDTVPNQSIYNEEYFDGNFFQKELVAVGNSYYTFVYKDGQSYLRKIYGDTFGMYELSGYIFPYDIFRSSDGENIIFLGTNGEGKFVARKVSPTGTTIWETEVGDNDTSWLIFDKNNIVGRAYNNSVVMMFHDNSLNKGVVTVLNDDTGSKVSVQSVWTDTARFYKAFTYSGNIGFALAYVSSGQYMLQFVFYDTNGNIVKQIFQASPINPNRENIIYDAFASGSYIYTLFGVNIDDHSVITTQNYSVYAMAIPYADSNLSNAMIIPIHNTYLPKGSAIYSNFTGAFDENYDYSWVIFTSPYYSGQFSKKILLKIVDSLPTTIYSSTDMPYKVTGMVDILGLFLITGQQPYFIILPDSTRITRTKYIEKTLIGDNVLNY